MTKAASGAVVPPFFLAFAAKAEPSRLQSRLPIV
jgi:hypothetical protein